MRNASMQHVPTHNPSLDPILSMRPHASWRMASTRAGVSLPALRWTSAATSAGDELRLHRVRYEKRVSIVCVLCCGPSTLRSASMDGMLAGWPPTMRDTGGRLPLQSLRHGGQRARHGTAHDTRLCDAMRAGAMRSRCRGCWCRCRAEQHPHRKSRLSFALTGYIHRNNNIIAEHSRA